VSSDFGDSQCLVCDVCSKPQRVGLISGHKCCECILYEAPDEPVGALGRTRSKMNGESYGWN